MIQLKDEVFNERPVHLQDGSLVYDAANICIHFFTFEFLERVVSSKEKFLHHHVAKKKIPYINEAGEQCFKNELNFYHLEY